MTAATSSPNDPLPTARASITLRLHAPADRAFPMFDPVNESLWNPHWHPTLLGDARVATGLVFITNDEDGRAAWLLDRYEPRSRPIRYVVADETTLTTIDVVGRAGDDEQRRDRYLYAHRPRSTCQRRSTPFCSLPEPGPH